MFVTIATPFILCWAAYLIYKDYKNKHKKPTEHHNAAMKQLSPVIEPTKDFISEPTYKTLQTEEPLTVTGHPVEEDNSLVEESSFVTKPATPPPSYFSPQVAYPVLSNELGKIETPPPPTYWSPVNSNYHSITPYSGYQSPAPTLNSNQYMTTTYTMPSKNQNYVNYYTAPAHYTPMTNI